MWATRDYVLSSAELALESVTAVRHGSGAWPAFAWAPSFSSSAILSGLESVGTISAGSYGSQGQSCALPKGVLTTTSIKLNGKQWLSQA